MPSTRLLFVRHAQTMWNIEHRYAGDSEVPLAPESKEQIKAISKRLKEEEIDVIYSSPLKRCLITITPTAEHHHRRIIIKKELKERNLGDWEGQVASEIHKTHGGYHFPESAYDGSFRVPNSEPLDHLEERLRRVLHEVVEAHPNQCVCLTTHAGVIWMLQARVLLNPPEKLYWASNCALVSVCSEEGHFRLEKIEEPAA